MRPIAQRQPHSLFFSLKEKSFLYRTMAQGGDQANGNNRPTVAEAAVLLQSVEMPEDAVLVKGPDFNKQLSLTDLLGSYKTMGFQASSLGEAIEIVEKMVYG